MERAFSFARQAPAGEGLAAPGQVSRARLLVLRAMYLVIVVGLGLTLWPDVVAPGTHRSIAGGMADCMLAAFSLMCALGLRYPLRMLPVLLWEITWKTMWVVLVPLPQWMGGHMDPALQPQVFAVSLVVLVYLAVPWRYVAATYIRAPAERW